MAKDEISARLEQLRENSQPAADASVTPSVSAAAEEQFACALCYRPFPQNELTVASKERFNFEAAVVCCSDCLGQLQAEMKQRSGSADLVLGTVWGVLALLLVAVPLGLAIWFNYKWPEREVWLWLGCYLAFFPGFVIGRAVYYGVGRKQSIYQQLIAVGLTLICALTVCYVAQSAAINFQLDIIYKNGHPLELMSALTFLINYFFGPLLSGGLNITVMLGTVFGLLVGLVVAWFASAGPRLFTRPFSTGQQASEV